MPPVADARIAQLYRDCQDLALYIAKARREIAAMRPDELKVDRLPRAGRELEAIVQATETATQGIMTAAEEIMAVDRNRPEAGQMIEDACMRIFEACSFQDITGQRITKVVNTLTYIEDRLNTLQAAWGPDLKDAVAEADETPDADPDRVLLNGPALAGEGVSQADVDALMAADPPQAKPAQAKPAAAPAKPTQADIDAMFD